MLLSQSSLDVIIDGRTYLEAMSAERGRSNNSNHSEEGERCEDLYEVMNRC